MKSTCWNISVLALMMLASCDRPGPMEDNIAPDISILSPQQGETVDSRDSVGINVMFSENNQLHEVGVWIWTEENDEFVANFLFHNHDSVFVVKKKFFFPVQTTTLLRLEAEATDHNQNTSEQSLTFQLIP